MDDQADASAVRREFDTLLARYTADGERLAALTEQLALLEIQALLPDAAVVSVHGWTNEDWLKVLRIRSVRSATGEVLYDTDAGAHPEVEDALHEIVAEMLDLLFDLTGGAYMGSHELKVGQR